MKYFLTISFTIIIQLLWSQPGGKLYKPSKDFFAFKDDRSGKWGFRMSKQNDFHGDITFAKYDRIWFNVNTGFWMIENDSLYGCATSDGRTIIEPVFETLDVATSDDYCELTHASVKKDGKWGVLGLMHPIAGKMIVDPQYGAPIIYHRGFVLTKISNDLSASDWGIADTADNIIEPFIHKRNEIQFCNMNSPCLDFFIADGLSYYIVQDHKAAWFSIEGTRLTDYKYQSICCKSGQYAIAQLDQLEIGIIDTTGSEIVPCIYEGIWYMEESRKILAYGIKDWKKYYFDYEGNIVDIKELTEKEKTNWESRTRHNRKKKQ